MLNAAEAPGRTSLEDIAMLALEFGRLLMEAGAGARAVDEIMAQVAAGLGAERVDSRVGYASIAITIGVGPTGITRMCRVGPLGVNQRLYHALRTAASCIERGGFSVSDARAELARLVDAPSRHPDWLVAVAVGVACAAFGRLLGVDWASVGPICVAAALGQLVRRGLAMRHVNVFVSATVVAFLAATLSGLGARWAGSQTVTIAMGAPCCCWCRVCLP
jgi:uncharacterized membrane protein YjjP (DUF1212 family)